MTQQDITVTTSTARYPVIVAAGALATLPDRLAALGLAGTLWLVSDSTVFPHYGATVEARLRGAGFAVHCFVVPAGEASKSQAQLAELYTWLIGGGVERRDAILALGGGVIGDLAGFAAASVLRGIALVQLPTTLLAMVDAAVGGKTGINHPLGKNLIGAFHQPRLVLADTLTLQTLPVREVRAGWAEVIKHGMIRDADLFAALEQRPPADDGLLADNAAISALVRQAVQVKVDVVSADEHEQGERIILNYGHTIGHALENALGYGTLLHGEAVAIGMHVEAQIAAALGMIAPETVARQQRLLTAYGLPTAVPPALDQDDILALILRDKKVQRKRIRWVLPTAIGAVAVRDDVSTAIVQAALADHTPI